MWSNFDIESFFGKTLDYVDGILANKADHIKDYYIPKKDGTRRHVTAPDNDLKWLQKTIYWRFFSKYRSHNGAHGFVRHRGIVTGAKIHLKANCIGKIDIKSFFDTINVNHVKNVICGNRQICKMCKHYEDLMDGKCSPSIYHNKEIKYTHRCEELKALFIPDYCERTGYQSLFLRIIDACTYKGVTPQGFPTSPILANIVMKGFDKTMSEYCNEKEIAYSRYADDLAFSSLTKDVKTLKEDVKKKAYALLFAYGFTPNYKKTVWKSKTSRMKICGVVVNQVLNIPRWRYMNFKAQVFNATVRDADKTTKKDIKILKGFASFIMSINHNKGKKMMDKLTAFESKLS